MGTPSLDDVETTMLTDPAETLDETERNGRKHSTRETSRANVWNAGN